MGGQPEKKERKGKGNMRFSLASDTPPRARALCVCLCVCVCTHLAHAVHTGRSARPAPCTACELGPACVPASLSLSRLCAALALKNGEKKNTPPAMLSFRSYLAYSALAAGATVSWAFVTREQCVWREARVRE